jgi:Tol biopolymer transport system component
VNTWAIAKAHGDGAIRNTIRSSAMLIIGAVALISCRSPAASLERGGKIAFMSDRDGDFEIYVMNADGTAATQLTDNTERDTDPAWSPDGRRIAFASNRDGDSDIYVMNADGSQPRNLTGNAIYDGSPSWHPDGTSIAFNRKRRGVFSAVHIFIMKPNGSGQSRLISHSDNDLEPDWSPDGRAIAFECDEDICTVGMDDKQVTNVTDSRLPDSSPDWSPNGDNIGFTRTTLSIGEIYLYAVSADGSREERITDSPGLWGPGLAWSPSGDTIAVPGGHYEGGLARTNIWLMRSDGTNATMITDSSGVSEAPDWKPGTP